jgi:hypothetical protein
MNFGSVSSQDEPTALRDLLASRLRHQFRNRSVAIPFRPEPFESRGIEPLSFSLEQAPQKEKKAIASNRALVTLTKGHGGSRRWF